LSDSFLHSTINPRERKPMADFQIQCSQAQPGLNYGTFGNEAVVVTVTCSVKENIQMQYTAANDSGVNDNCIPNNGSVTTNKDGGGVQVNVEITPAGAGFGTLGQNGTFTAQGTYQGTVHSAQVPY
jgi:hypothetical protein